MSYCNGEKPKINISEVQIFYFLTITVNVHSKFTTLVSLQSFSMVSKSDDLKVFPFLSSTIQFVSLSSSPASSLCVFYLKEYRDATDPLVFQCVIERVFEIYQQQRFDLLHEIKFNQSSFFPLCSFKPMQTCFEISLGIPPTHCLKLRSLIDNCFNSETLWINLIGIFFVSQLVICQ